MFPPRKSHHSHCNVSSHLTGTTGTWFSQMFRAARMRRATSLARRAILQLNEIAVEKPIFVDMRNQNRRHGALPTREHRGRSANTPPTPFPSLSTPPILPHPLKPLDDTCHSSPQTLHKLSRHPASGREPAEMERVAAIPFPRAKPHPAPNHGR